MLEWSFRIHVVKFEEKIDYFLPQHRAIYSQWHSLPMSSSLGFATRNGCLLVRHPTLEGNTGHILLCGVPLFQWRIMWAPLYTRPKSRDDEELLQENHVANFRDWLISRGEKRTHKKNMCSKRDVGFQQGRQALYLWKCPKQFKRQPSRRAAR